MEEKYYTVEKVAEIVGMHPKTILRFIREGKLKANKVGREWRISGHDLSIFVEGKDRRKEDPMNEDSITDDNEIDKIKVSAVADINVFDVDEAMRIANTISAIMNNKDPSYGKSTITTQYIESENKIRVMLWGSASFIEVMMGSLAMLVK
jgi:excisionase family DNA binding protein